MMDVKAPSMSEVNKPTANEASTFDPDKRIESGISAARDSVESYDPDKRLGFSSQETGESRKYVDDNGNVYRVGDSLVQNNTYEINGYKYQTDQEGRIISAEGKLHIKEHSGYQQIKDSKEVVGEGYQKQTDDRGHLIGDQFGGSNGKENLLPQDAKLNQGEVKNLENALAQQVKDGKDVYLKIEPHFEDGSKRPDSYTYTYSINGEVGVKFFRNGEG